MGGGDGGLWDAREGRERFTEIEILIREVRTKDLTCEAPPDRGKSKCGEG